MFYASIIPLQDKVTICHRQPYPIMPGCGGFMLMSNISQHNIRNIKLMYLLARLGDGEVGGLDSVV
jgi:hypothetical protein